MNPIYKVKLKYIVRHLTTGEALQYIWNVVDKEAEQEYSVCYIKQEDSVCHSDGRIVGCPSLIAIIKELSGEV